MKSYSKTPTLLLLLCLALLQLTLVLSESEECVEEEGISNEKKDEALRLRIAAIFAILFSSCAGILIPILGKSYPALSPGSNLFFLLKAFAGGVILAVAFVHIIPESFHALSSPCLPEEPWHMFPFAGFIAMLGVIATLVVDSVAFGYYTRSASGDVVDVAEDSGQNERTDVEMDNKQVSDDSSRQAQLLIRHRVASQVLELGILVHSIIIGISLGASESPSTVRPLLAALSFHQFFEGIGLGGCIIQAKFKTKSIVSMVVFFCMTTSVGVIIGIGISSVYNENNVTALIVQGILNSVSAGILVYMALVDLLAADFMSDKVQKNGKLQIGLNFSLLAGVGLMSLLAKWA